MTTTSPHRAARAAAATALMAIALAACGGSGEPAPSAVDRAPTGAASTSSSAPEEPVSPTSTPTPTPTDAEPPAVAASLEVSGDGIGSYRFGADAEETTAGLAERLGQPSLVVEPVRWSRTEGEDGWFQRAGDPISPSWDHEFASVECWADFCAIFGGPSADRLSLRGWELADYNRWDEAGADDDGERPDVRLRGSGITLGDSWTEVHRAYPRTVVQQAEGASLAVARTPWSGIFDGVAGWRLSGYWDYEHPGDVPADAVVTRLSGGEGPEPGCC